MCSKLLCFVLSVFLGLATTESQYKPPTIFITTLVRNKAHILPYFLSYLEQLDYPKERISLWILSDHNSDQSIPILKSWVDTVREQYHSIYTEFEDGYPYTYPGEEGPGHWTEDRFKHLMQTKDSSLFYAKQKWADFYLSLDADVLLTNPNTLNHLIAKNLTIVAPMLESEGIYSNFWHGMTEDYYYLRTKGYTQILKRENVSCFAVAMIHSCVLVDLRRAESDFLTYRPDKIKDYQGPYDDMIAFGLSASLNNIPLYICNEELFGYIPIPLDQDDDMSSDFDHLLNIKMEILNSGQHWHLTKGLSRYVKLPKKDSMMFDKIFMINLKRRSDRRKRMQLCFEELGLMVEIIDAVDGKLLNDSILQHLEFMPDFQDPYHKRPMKLGEIGCFLSHYLIWIKVIENNYKSVLVLEDDLRFETFFRYRVKSVMSEVSRIVPEWDLVYFGRKKMQDNDEPWVEGADFLVEAGYSYWTLGYVLSMSGATKLLDAEPLKKLVPVDEYLPILFDKHPKENWKGHYPKRDLIALSAAPLLVYPTHYTGEKGYISDTEDSKVISETVRIKEDL
ncbi:glycosyltransferase 25 family member [Euwallacea similis]|uniref:glycosyltransferase 25 family member n=1 Tax=Euwallacea similis TaxID=1736056 RepID=UPI00344CC24E